MSRTSTWLAIIMMIINAILDGSDCDWNLLKILTVIDVVLKLKHLLARKKKRELKSPPRFHPASLNYQGTRMRWTKILNSIFTHSLHNNCNDTATNWILCVYSSSNKLQFLYCMLERSVHSATQIQKWGKLYFHLFVAFYNVIFQLHWIAFFLE